MNWNIYRARLRPDSPNFPVITEIHDESGNVMIKWQGFDGMRKKDVIRISRLIVKAVNSHEELVEACKECLKFFNWEKDKGEPVDLVAMLHKALTKATGGNG